MKERTRPGMLMHATQVVWSTILAEQSKGAALLYSAASKREG
jgi:hypothetical protein